MQQTGRDTAHLKNHEMIKIKSDDKANLNYY